MDRTDCEKCLNSEFYDGDKLRCKLMRCNPRYEDMEDTKKWLVDSFPGSFINNSYEFILGSIGFSLRDCRYPEDVECKVLEWLSGVASEDLYILQGINKYLCFTDFSKDEMREIYSHLGNACNHQKTLEFIKSNYDMNVLKAEKENNMQKKLKEIKPGEVFTYAEYEWIKLEQEGLCLMKNILEERAFDEDSNDWRRLELREYLNNDFHETLIKNGADEKDFLMIETDLTADDGLKDYGTSKDLISLMTADLYRKNRRLLKPLESWWWLATPHSCLASYSSGVRYVNSSGTLSLSFTYIGYGGVRPLCNLKSETKVSVLGEEKEEETREINTTELIKKWATDRNLDKADPKAQMVKLMEEVGELANGINKDKKEQTIDSIGDIYVVLVILCMQLDLDINDCIKTAYDEIKDRKGKMVNGLFVKEGDLE